MDMFAWEPRKARLDKQGKVNAWTSGHNDQSQWLQVNFHKKFHRHYSLWCQYGEDLLVWDYFLLPIVSITILTMPRADDEAMKGCTDFHAFGTLVALIHCRSDCAAYRASQMLQGFQQPGIFLCKLTQTVFADLFHWLLYCWERFSSCFCPSKSPWKGIFTWDLCTWRNLVHRNYLCLNENAQKFETSLTLLRLIKHMNSL